MTNVLHLHNIYIYVYVYIHFNSLRVCTSSGMHESWKSVILVQGCWRTIKRIHVQINANIIKNTPARIMVTGSVMDVQRTWPNGQFSERMLGSCSSSSQKWSMLNLSVEAPAQTILQNANKK